MEKQKNQNNLLILKAISDENRLAIVRMLSCGELCACVILEKFSFTQPTLSHHMRTLLDANLILARKSKKNVYYKINDDVAANFIEFIKDQFSGNNNCICHKK